MNEDNREGINFVAIDFETATTKAACQIGIAVVRQGLIVEEICHFIQPPANRYSKKTIEIHHITPDLTANAPTFAELWPQIRKYFHCQLIVCHNASFDFGILDKEFERYNLQSFKPLDVVCTYELTRMSLEKACAFYGIALDNHHNALSDAKACAQLFIEYLVSDKELYDEEYDAEEEYEIVKEYPIKGETITFHEAIKSDLLKQDLSNANPNNPFYDKKVVITGIFQYDRNYIAEILKKNGADINTSISRKTNMVLVGDEPGPKKIEKIQELLLEGYDIKLITADELETLIETHQIDL